MMRAEAPFPPHFMGRWRGRFGVRDGGGGGTMAGVRNSKGRRRPLHRYAVPLPTSGEETMLKASRVARNRVGG